LVSTCVILSGMTNIVCLLYVGWITNYVANVGPKVAEKRGESKERKLEEEGGKGETLRIIERLERLESVVNEHIKGKPLLFCPWRRRHVFVSTAHARCIKQQVLFTVCRPRPRDMHNPAVDHLDVSLSHLTSIPTLLFFMLTDRLSTSCHNLMMNFYVL